VNYTLIPRTRESSSSLSGSSSSPLSAATTLHQPTVSSVSGSTSLLPPYPITILLSSPLRPLISLLVSRREINHNTPVPTRINLPYLRLSSHQPLLICSFPRSPRPRRKIMRYIIVPVMHSRRKHLPAPTTKRPPWPERQCCSRYGDGDARGPCQWGGGWCI